MDDGLDPPMSHRVLVVAEHIRHTGADCVMTTGRVVPIVCWYKHG